MAWSTTSSAPTAIRRMVPDLDIGAPGAVAPGEGGKRLPVLAGAWHPGAGIARHDAVAWGYARAADGLGVDIIQNCEVTGFQREGGRVTAVETTRGTILAGKVGIAVAGNAGVLAGMAGFRLPIETWPLVAFVSEPLKPFLNTCINCPATQVYVNQSDKGELVIGGGPDRYRSYAQKGDWDTVETVTRSHARPFSAAWTSEAAAPMGRHDRRRLRYKPDPVALAPRECLPERRVGFGRVQGDPGRRRGVRKADRIRRAGRTHRPLRT